MAVARLEPRVHHRLEDDRRLPYVVWLFDRPRLVLSSAPVGGGWGWRRWVLNAQVRPGYDRIDLDEHVQELAAAAGLPGEGVGLLTSADADRTWPADDGGVHVWASVGVKVPGWAAVPASTAATVPTPGTINLVAELPVPFDDGALVNLATTATEAKTQALLELGIDGTGTATDAVCLVTADRLPATRTTGASLPVDHERSGVERFGGPRSVWGARLARAVHDAVRRGTAYSLDRIRAEAEDHRR